MIHLDSFASFLQKQLQRKMTHSREEEGHGDSTAQVCLDFQSTIWIQAIEIIFAVSPLFLSNPCQFRPGLSTIWRNRNNATKHACHFDRSLFFIDLWLLL